jgi:TorA maturation chaperone TorD
MPRPRAEARAPTTRASDAWTPADLAAIRAILYRLAAVAFLYPEPARWTWLCQVGEACRRSGPRLALFPFFSWWSRLLPLLRPGTAARLAALQEEHVRLFHVGSAPSCCQPYESWYLASDSVRENGLILQLQQTYRRAGLTLAPSFGERPDHVSVELEFMAHLCFAETAAWQNGEFATLQRCLEREGTFLTLHLGRWIGALARDISAQSAEPLYCRLAEAVTALVVHDRDLTWAVWRAVQHRLPIPPTNLPGEDGPWTTG